MHELVQIWLKSISQVNNNVTPLNVCCQKTTSNLDVTTTDDFNCLNINSLKYLSIYNTSLNAAIATRTSAVHGLLLRCIPTASCISQKPVLDNVEDAEEDSLPGVRIQRKSSVEHRTNTIVTEQEIGQWMEKETGMDRVRLMYSINNKGEFIQQETKELNTMLFQCFILGTALSVVMAAATVYARNKETQPSSTRTMLQGVPKKKKPFKGIIIESLKSTLRFTAFSTLLIHFSQTLAAYRNKSSVWEYAISLSLGCGLLGLGQGLKTCAKMSLKGAVIGTVGGYVVCQLLTFNGMNQEQNHLAAVIAHLREQKLQNHKVQDSE